jgi:flagellar hook assembly protein FlgD
MGWAVGVGGQIHKMTSIVTGITGTGSSTLEKYSLGQNYPNPFNPTTKIDFELPVSSNVKITIYDNTGRMVKVFKEGNLSAGKYQYEFNGENLSSGVYYCRLESGDFAAIRKMVLMK